MASKDRFFGYWIAVHDAHSASYALRMAGLPILLTGMDIALFALLAAVWGVLDTGGSAWRLAIALPLVVIAFRIRAGHAPWLPVALALAVVMLVARLQSSLAVWRMTGGDRIAQAQLLASWIVPLFCTALMLGGLRGWLWLRSHNIRRSF